MKKITIKDAATIEAKGTLNSRKCKPVICIDTGEVYTSATDAANANGTTVYGVSTVCLGKVKTANGKRFCYVQDFPEHLADITARISSMNKGYAEMVAKAAAYDAILAEQKANERAEEKRQKAITKANEKLARRREIYAKAERKLDEAYQFVREAEEELASLNGNKKRTLIPYEITPKNGGFNLHINGMWCGWVPDEATAEQCINYFSEHSEELR